MAPRDEGARAHGSQVAPDQAGTTIPLKVVSDLARCGSTALRSSFNPILFQQPGGLYDTYVRLNGRDTCAERTLATGVICPFVPLSLWDKSYGVSLRENDMSLFCIQTLSNSWQIIPGRAGEHAHRVSPNFL